MSKPREKVMVQFDITSTELFDVEELYGDADVEADITDDEMREAIADDLAETFKNEPDNIIRQIADIRVQQQYRTSSP